MDTINFNYDLFQQLKKEYAQAVQDKKESFMFDGKYQLVVAYAKYMIEYLEPKFNNPKLN